MDLKRICSYDEAASGSSYPPKRQKTLQYHSNDALPHNRYTIAWICALHIEMAAARAMLDETHGVLPQNAHDGNTYTLGSIGPHNIVLACLPNGQYGTNNAASVLTNMLRSFPSICHGFIVGIGGGVPSRADMRLGDVVVGTRVMQYDSGKLIDGNIQRTADARIPSYPLRTAVSSLRSTHELEPSRVSTILQDMATGYPEYGHPASPDRLFRVAYKHKPQLLSCNDCDQSELLSRSPRPPYHPKIHHGGIASGNQVMKDSIARDSIARELDIICFEMEAAGLMDVLPCLPVRGICDYSDSHKSKEWQKYAAATAASYAKELIEILPVNDGTFESLDIHNSPSQNASPDRRQLLLESLRFEQIDSRKTSIKKAHYKTCRWFLEHPQYLQWLDPQEHSHLGFLWIRGKPGAGKSTIMKFIYDQTKKKKSREGAITASFFFHARGDDLEKSIPGMYRSLLLQLLEGYPDLQEALDDTDLVPRGQAGCPSLNILKDLFHNAVSNLGRRTFTCFIDALDECDEQQVMEMVHYFEELAESSASIGVQLQICFSSRHYPYIRIRHGIELTLEDQQGHSQDMDKYIQSNLRIGDNELFEELRPQMLEKAAGVFLWLVLVVDILNKENCRGRLALRKRLAETPTGLSELFNDILRRDTKNMEDLLLCILWILCAKRPLLPEEYYHALWSGLVQKGLADSEVPNVEVADFSDCVKGHVITSSKGLAELTKTKSPTVQFIHESVTDFLVKDRGLQELWPDLGYDWQSQGHERLKQCCSTYINHHVVRKSVSSIWSITPLASQQVALGQYPFLEYASQYILYHSNAAARAIPQGEFLSQTPALDWIATINLCEKFPIRRYSPAASLVYILADKGFSELIRSWLQSYPDIDIPGERYKYPLFAALVNGHKDAFASLLGSTWTICEGVEHVGGFGSKKDFVAHKDRTPLTWAAQEGLSTVVKLLAQSGADVDGVDLRGYTPLMRASEAGRQAVVSFLVKQDAAAKSLHARKAMSIAMENGQAEMVKLLMEANIHWDYKPGTLQEALRRASEKGNEAMVQLLIEKEVDIDAQDFTGRTALSIACDKDNFQMVKLLIEANADLKLNPRSLQAALRRASEKGNEAMVQFLIEKEVDIDAQDFTGHTALSLASGNGHLPIVKLLIGNTQVEPGLSGKVPRPALVEASKYGNEPVVKFLIEKGAELNACDLEGQNALSRASRGGYLEIVKILLESGPQINPGVNGSKLQLAFTEALRGGHDGVVGLWLELGANVGFRDENGRTPLIEASQQGNEATVRLLLERGASVGSRDENGRTPLIEASRHGNEATVRLLLKRGASVGSWDENGRTPLIEASRHGNEATVRLLLKRGASVGSWDENGRMPLIEASRHGNEATVRLLLKRGASVGSWDKNGRTPLIEASRHGNEGVVRLLIEQGADANAQDISGQSPLHHACIHGRMAIQRLLIDERAYMNAIDEEKSTPFPWACQHEPHDWEHLLFEEWPDVNESNGRGQTPLRHAYRPHFREYIEGTVRLLIEKGASIDARDNEGSTPLHLAVVQCYSPLVRILVCKGADVNAINNSSETPASLVEKKQLPADDPLVLAIKGL